MKCKILHESEGRMRVHICAGHMSCRQADILEYYLAAKGGVVSVKIYERTGDAAVCYVGARDGALDFDGGLLLRAQAVHAALGALRHARDAYARRIGQGSEQ